MNLVTIRDIEKRFIEKLFEKTLLLKDADAGKPLDGKTLALVFEKPSNRTRVSFTVAMYQLGGSTVHLDQTDIGLGARESVGDVARVLSRYVDAIVLRTFAHKNILEMAAAAEVPVINGLSDRVHPCQVLSDVFTIKEKIPGGKFKVAFIGDGNNVAHSWLYASSKLGFDLSVAAPAGYEPLPEIVEEAVAGGMTTGAAIKILNDSVEAVAGADIIYTDVWASMGDEKESEKRKSVFRNFCVTEDLVRKTGTDTMVMHCLPAHRGEEITDAVLDGPSSIVLDEAENRLHVQKALLTLLLD